MTAKQFFDKVKVLREAQKRYFRYRNHQDLLKARALEVEIDAEIARVVELTQHKVVQLSMF